MKTEITSKHMQAAVEAVAQSRHHTNKVGAALHTLSKQLVSEANHWPDAIADKLGKDARIGNASGTVHAETAVLLKAIHDGMKAGGGSLYVTDPPCPNCAKNIAEAGIAALYIDHKGFEKDFFLRREENFQTLSIPILEHAGIEIFKIFRKEEKVETLLSIDPNYDAPNDNPVKITPAKHLNQEVFHQAIEERAGLDDAPFALALGEDYNRNPISISASPHLSIGYLPEESDLPSTKYSAMIQPLTRILMNAARFGLKLDPNFAYSSRVPAARELVNFVGAGFDRLKIGDTESARDAYGPEALKKLVDAGVLKTNKKK